LVTKSDKPDTPEFVVLRKRSSRALVFSWTPPSANGEKQLVFTAQLRQEGFQWSEVYAGSVPNCTLRNLNPNSNYTFRVSAANVRGSSVFSSIVSTSTRPAEPKAPTKLTATVNATSVVLDWRASKEFGSTAIAYEVFYGELTAEELHRGYVGLATRAVIKGLIPYEKYRFRVRVLSAAGSSDYAEVEATSSGSTPLAPFPPSVLFKTNSSVTLQWGQTAEAEAFAAVATWRLEIYVPSQDGLSVEDMMKEAVYNSSSYQLAYKGQDKNFTMTELEPNKVYFFRIQGINLVGDGKYSFPLSVSTAESNSVPDAPLPLELGDLDNDFVTISWKSQGTDNLNPVLEYVLERTQGWPWDLSLDGDKQAIIAPAFDDDKRMERLPNQTTPLSYSEVYRGTDPIARVGSLRAGYAYAIRARIVNQIGDSLPTAWQVFHTRPSPPITPATPTLVAKSATELRVEWSRPADGGSLITTYNVVLDDTSINVNDARFYIAKGLVPGSDHTFAIVATNKLGSTTGPVATFRTLPSAPFKPNAPIVEHGPVNAGGEPTMIVSWSTAIPAGSDVTGYSLEMRDPLTNVYKAVLSNQLVFRADINHGVVPSTQYVFRMFAHSLDGVSESSNVAMFTSQSLVPTLMPPPRLHGLTARTALFMWDDLTFGQNEFELRVGTKPQNLTIVYKGIGTSTLLTLTPATRYIAQIRATNGRGNGPWSDELLFTSETLCVGDDGSVCSKKGQCVDGVCQCYPRYTGARCEFQIAQTMCAAYGAGHRLTFDGRSYVTTASGEYLAYALSKVEVSVLDELSVSVHFHSRPIEFNRPNMTAIDSVAIRVGGQVLTLSTSRRPMQASNNIYIRVGCGPSFAMDVRRSFDDGYDVPDSPFHVRYDFNKRFIVSVSGSGIRVIVQTWKFGEINFLNAFVIDSKPRLASLLGTCGEYASDDDDVASLEQYVDEDGGYVSATWFDQWLIPVQQNITLCPEDANPAFDMTRPVVPPKTPIGPANDPLSADLSILNLLELDSNSVAEGSTILDHVCHDAKSKAAAQTNCRVNSRVPSFFRSCVWDVCALDGGDGLMMSHSDAHRTIVALNEAISTEFANQDQKEVAAAQDGSLTGGQLPLPVCPQ
jgi:hypothetical protein